MPDHLLVNYRKSLVAICLAQFNSTKGFEGGGKVQAFTFVNHYQFTMGFKSKHGMLHSCVLLGCSLSRLQGCGCCKMLYKFCLTGVKHGSMQMQSPGFAQHVGVTQGFLCVISHKQYAVSGRHCPAIM